MSQASRSVVVGFALLTVVATGPAAAEIESGEGGMTGEILTLLYVTDVRRSVEFYEAVGFTHYFYYDYEKDEYVLDWDQPYPPEYAEMTSGSIRVALTTADEPDAVYGGGVRHYFMVDEVERRYERLKRLGIVAEPDEVERRPWMDFITLSDPDGHQIVFGKIHRAYYDRARAEVERLHRDGD